MSDAPERGLGFGRQAGLYARSRPGYPDELFDELLCAVPGRRVLEALRHGGASAHPGAVATAGAATARGGGGGAATVPLAT